MANREFDDGEATVRNLARLTVEQARAVATRGVSIVLSSGAGCGKTHVLTQRYLAHLHDDGAEVGQLAAITFTDRAARQMRGRIREAVKKAIQTGVPGPERDSWKRHERNLESATICTIHAFCGALLRQHALVAGLDPRFEVLEEVLTVNLRDDALRDGLHHLLTATTAVGDDLRELVTLYGWRVTVGAIEHLVDAHDVAAWDVWSHRPAGEIADSWLSQQRSDILPKYIEHLIRAAPKITHCLRLLRSTPCVGPKMRANVEQILGGTPRLAEVADLGVAVNALTEAAKVTGTERAKAWPDEATYEAIKAVFDDFREDLPKRLDPFMATPERPDAAVAVGQRFVRVAAECVRVYSDRKRRAGVVDLHDLLTLARDLLRDRREVREQVRRRFRFVLIDELQDTDPVQMELVELLCAAGITHGKLFAVGDAKQSIYRFRGAEVALFQALQATMPSDGRQSLSVNFRSQPAILHFVNALLRPHMPGYEPLRPHRPQVNAGPCVEFLWCSRGDKESVGEGRRREADMIAGRIAALVGRGEALVVDGKTACLRPVRQQDVVLLFRSMSNVAIYEAALRRHGLDYYLVGGRAFFAQQEVYDLLNLLRVLENPQDAVSLAGTLRSPFGCLSDEALYWLAQHPDGLWAGLHDGAALDRLAEAERTAVERARRFFDRWRERKDRLPIVGLLNLVLADCGYDAALQYEFLGDRKLANLWKMIDLARTFDRSGLFGLADFIQRLGDLVQAQPREEQAATLPENADVVRLMTIHQAKGLEFPVVVLPDLAATTGGAHLPVAHWDRQFGCIVRPPADDDPPLFSDVGRKLWRVREALDEWHEDVRTLYVACTRAEDYLILSAALPESLKPVNTAVTVLAEQFDVRTGDCLDPTVPTDERPNIRVKPSDGSTEDITPIRRAVESPVALTAADADAVAPIPVRWPPGAVVVLTTASKDQLLGDDGREHVLRAVVTDWDFRDHDGWQHLLADALSGLPSVARSSPMASELASGLRAFADSELRRHIATASEVWRDLEYLFPSSDDGVVLRGWIDLLWRDAAGGQHVLAWDFGRLAVGDVWQGRKNDLLVQSWAIQRQTEMWPRTIILYSFARAADVTTRPRERQARLALETICAKLVPTSEVREE
jgi:ATP-dependent helicase/nuclease subunit A